MIRISRLAPKNAVLHWRAANMHPACTGLAASLDPQSIAGPYVLLADAALIDRRHSRPVSNPKPNGISA